MNVFKRGWLPWGYIGNWWRNVTLFFRHFKWAWQRATRGFADCDVWDMYSWIFELFHDSLTFLADNHFGYPGTEEFRTDESWTEYLKSIAQKFYQADEMNEFYSTPIYDKWREWNEQNRGLELNKRLEENPYRMAFIEESRENDRKMEADFKEAWDKMGRVMFHLWD